MHRFAITLSVALASTVALGCSAKIDSSPCGPGAGAGSPSTCVPPTPSTPDVGARSEGKPWPIEAGTPGAETSPPPQPPQPPAPDAGSPTPATPDASPAVSCSTMTENECKAAANCAPGYAGLCDCGYCAGPDGTESPCGSCSEGCFTFLRCADWNPICPKPGTPGVHYISTSVQKCAMIDFACTGGFVPMVPVADACGCGCIDPNVASLSPEQCDAADGEAIYDIGDGSLKECPDGRTQISLVPGIEGGLCCKRLPRSSKVVSEAECNAMGGEAIYDNGGGSLKECPNGRTQLGVVPGIEGGFCCAK